MIVAAGCAPAATQAAQIKLVAHLTSDGQRIDKGLVWRVFEDKPARDGKPKMLSTLREATPTLRLPPGDYVVNASYGRANLTRKITAKAGANTNLGTSRFQSSFGGGSPGTRSSAIQLRSARPSASGRVIG